MNDNNTIQVNKVEKLIQEATTIGVIPSKVSGLDAFCAGVGLFHMLKQAGKKAVLIYPGKTPDETKDIMGEDEITKDIKQRSLLVSIDYSGTDAANVHYSTENDVLQIKILPIPNDFNRDDRVKAKVVGYDFDLIFVIGAQNTGDLGTTYENLDSLSKTSRIINLDNVGSNARFGFINIVNTEVSTLSLLIFQKAGAWGLTPNIKSAKALLKGISSKDFVHKG